MISVFYDGEHISGSPFELKVFDPSLVNVYGLEGGSIGQALTFSGMLLLVTTSVCVCVCVCACVCVCVCVCV